LRECRRSAGLLGKRLCRELPAIHGRHRAALREQFFGRVYSRFGLGLGGETFPACMYALKNKGFTPERWTKYILDMLDYEASLNSPKQSWWNQQLGTPKNIELPTPWRGAPSGTNCHRQPGIIHRRRSRRSGRFALRGRLVPHVREAAGKVPLELQPSNKRSGRKRRVGSMVELLPFALRLRTQIFEIYVQDWLVAYDPSNPTMTATTGISAGL